MSNEKVDTIRALGAEIVQTPITAGASAPDGPILTAQRLGKEIPNAVVLEQVCKNLLYNNTFVIQLYMIFLRKNHI